MTTDIQKFVMLGRYMVDMSERFVDDLTYNTWVRVGGQLLNIGMPFSMAFKEFTPEDRSTALQAAKMMNGMLPLPEMKSNIKGRDRVKRPARMSKFAVKYLSDVDV